MYLRSFMNACNFPSVSTLKMIAVVLAVRLTLIAIFSRSGPNMEGKVRSPLCVIRLK